VAAIALQRYGWLLAEPRWLTAADAALRAAWQALEQHSAQHATLLQALDEQLQPPAIVVLRGAAPALAEWQRKLGAAYAPRRLTLAIAADVAALPAALADKPAPASGAVAYVCHGTTCEGPFTSLPAAT
jgi:uncharacterized protein YyaL (SSP411 family)